ncbi:MULTISPECIES: TIGR01841 family phasin [unclassified Burkholderia]|uniref:TIGR01841 family phasin n=1 Tax=unclassified Burkholderia TaxID=2613784 RepID=UPI001E5AADA0|nr:MULTISPECIES: TIGR01841 family phasin [unclassified Burkholderia]UEP31873.1 TIGR01841 family phasin [Burkholderia sp. B21-007]UEP45539.1 TIGR01841 family phasin [Burkholderia sp. B21-005]
MTGFTSDQLVASSKATATTTFALANQAFLGCEQMIQLNLQAARQALSESRSYWSEALSHKAPEHAIAHHTKLLQSSTKNALSYGGQLAAIASNTHAEWLKIVGSQVEFHSGNLPRF